MPFTLFSPSVLLFSFPSQSSFWNELSLLLACISFPFPHPSIHTNLALIPTTHTTLSKLLLLRSSIISVSQNLIYDFQSLFYLSSAFITMTLRKKFSSFGFVILCSSCFMSKLCSFSAFLCWLLPLLNSLTIGVRPFVLLTLFILHKQFNLSPLFQLSSAVAVNSIFAVQTSSGLCHVVICLLDISTWISQKH